MSSGLRPPACSRPSEGSPAPPVMMTVLTASIAALRQPHTSSKCETEASWPRRSRQPGNDTLTRSQPDIVVASNELASVIAAKITRWSKLHDLALERSEGSDDEPVLAPPRSLRRTGEAPQRSSQCGRCPCPSSSCASRITVRPSARRQTPRGIEGLHDHALDQRRATEFDAAKLVTGLHDDPSDRFVTLNSRRLDLNSGAHRLQRANEAGACLVDADVLDYEPPAQRARNDACDRQ